MEPRRNTSSKLMHPEPRRCCKIEKMESQSCKLWTIGGGLMSPPSGRASYRPLHSEERSETPASRLDPGPTEAAQGGFGVGPGPKRPADVPPSMLQARTNYQTPHLPPVSLQEGQSPLQRPWKESDREAFCIRQTNIPKIGVHQ